MNKFDKSVNILLENLIFEQDQNEIQKAQEIVDKAREDIKTQFDADPKTFIQNANNKIASYDYLANAFVDYVTKIKDSSIKTIQDTSSIKEQTDDTLQDVTSKVKDFAIQFGKKAGSMIGGAFEQGLDFVTDEVVEKVPSIMKGLMGSETYDKVRAEVDQMEDSFLYKVFAFLDPTGVLSWTYLEEAKSLYEKNLGTDNEDIYTLNLLAAAVAVIPGVSALKIFAVPFKILSPLKTIFGAKRAEGIAKAVANEFKTAFNLGGKMQKATTLGGKIGSFAKHIAKPIKPISKLFVSGGKAATIISSGDIPQTWKDWTEAGKKSLEDAKPMERTLGKFPSFSQLSTQRF
jgi:hypothetical protein